MKKIKQYLYNNYLYSWASSDILRLNLSGPVLWSQGWLHLLQAAFLAFSQFLSTASESLSSESALGTQLHWLTKSKYTNSPFNYQYDPQLDPKFLTVIIMLKSAGSRTSIWNTYSVHLKMVKVVYVIRIIP